MIDKEEFCNKIKQCEVSMYYLAYSIVKNKDDASDVINESILKAYEKLDKLKNEDAFKSWILRIVHNTAIELIRKNKDVVNIEEVNNILEVEESSDVETKLTLHDAINKLKYPYREVIILFYYEDFSTEKISKITNSNIFTVRKQLSRARKQLKAILKEEDIYGQ